MRRRCGFAGRRGCTAVGAIIGIAQSSTSVGAFESPLPEQLLQEAATRGASAAAAAALFRVVVCDGSICESAQSGISSRWSRCADGTPTAGLLLRLLWEMSCKRHGSSVVQSRGLKSVGGAWLLWQTCEQRIVGTAVCVVSCLHKGGSLANSHWW
jgi:hypothetical protein